MQRCPIEGSFLSVCRQHQHRRVIRMQGHLGHDIDHRLIPGLQMKDQDTGMPGFHQGHDVPGVAGLPDDPQGLALADHGMQGLAQHRYTVNQ